MIVRPFKPATEPRDLNPTDKTRANHIVDASWRSTRKSRPASWRMYWRTFRAAIATCWRYSRPGPTKWKRRWPLMAFFQRPAPAIGAYFLQRYSFEASALFNPSIVATPRPVGRPRRRPALRPEPPGRRRRARLVADLPSRHARSRRQVALDPTTRLAASPRVGHLQCVDPLGEKVEIAVQGGTGHQRTLSFRSRIAVARHRGCALRRFQDDGRKPTTRPTQPITAEQSDPNSSRRGIFCHFGCRH